MNGRSVCFDVLHLVTQIYANATCLIVSTQSETTSRWLKLSSVRSPGKSSEDVLDVRVVSSGLGDGDAQLGVAQRPDGGDQSRDDPDDQGQAHRAGVLHHSLRTDEDTWADNVTCRRERGEELKCVWEQLEVQSINSAFNFFLTISVVLTYMWK